eukprot:3905544-Amphidinium_carterae.1
MFLLLLDGSASQPAALHNALRSIHMPTICFLSGLCLQMAPVGCRCRHYFSFIIAPAFLWTFIVQPMVLLPLLHMEQWSTYVYNFLCGGQFHVLSRDVFQEMPYLWYVFPALAVWQASALLLGQ